MRLGVPVLLSVLLSTTAACGEDEPEPSAADIEICETVGEVSSAYQEAMDGPGVGTMAPVFNRSRDRVAELQDQVTVEEMEPEVQTIVDLPDSQQGVALGNPMSDWTLLGGACSQAGVLLDR